MAIRKTAKSILVNGKQLTPAGDISLPVVNNSWEGLDNLDGSTDWKYNPEKEPATLPVVLDEEARKHIVSTNSIEPGWSCTITFRDNSSCQLSNCGFVSVPALDGDGIVELEIKCSVRWL
jgi:hypothetical protein